METLLNTLIGICVMYTILKLGLWIGKISYYIIRAIEELLEESEERKKH